jgi:hypothetical protein
MKKMTISLFVLLSVFIASKAYAQSSAVPVVNTYKDATSTSVIINLPDGFNGSVMTTYDGNQIKTTYSTSTPITNEQFNKIEADIQAQEKAMDDLFKQQQKMFQQMWGDFGWN